MFGLEVFKDGPQRSQLVRNLKRGIASATTKVYSYAEATELDGRGCDRVSPTSRVASPAGTIPPGAAGTAIVMVDSTPELFRGQLAAMAAERLAQDSRGAGRLHQRLE